MLQMRKVASVYSLTREDNNITEPHLEHGANSQVWLCPDWVPSDGGCTTHILCEMRKLYLDLL